VSDLRTRATCVFAYMTIKGFQTTKFIAFRLILKQEFVCYLLLSN